MEIEPTFCIKLDLKRKDLCEKMHNISPTYDILKILLAEGRSSSCRREQTGNLSCIDWRRLCWKKQMMTIILLCLRLWKNWRHMM